MVKETFGMKCIAWNGLVVFRKATGRQGHGVYDVLTAPLDEILLHNEGLTEA